MDALANGMGAILAQEGEIPADLEKSTMPHLHPVAYYSATFTPMQKRYDIYEWEFLAIMKAFEHWQAYLAWGTHQVVVLTDYVNLGYWKHLRKLNDRTAHWYSKMADYDYIIKHV